MKNQKSKFLQAIIIVMVIITGSLFVTQCKSDDSGTNPDVGPASATAAAITVSGNVLDAKTNSGITGATVVIYKTDGTQVASVTSGTSGAFSYDVSQVKATSLKITATASGHGFAFTMANIDTAKKTAQAVSISLDQISSVSSVIPTTGGTVTTQTSTESKASQPLTMTIPAGAVTQSTSVQVSAIPVNNVPAPSSAASSSQVGVASILPQGITFSAPVKLAFPLPYKFKPNDQITLMELVNNVWQASSLKAVVDNSGYMANVNISKTSEYALLDNTSVSGNVVLGKPGSVMDERSFTFSDGVLTIELPSAVTFARTSQNVVTEVPTDEWIFNTLAQRYGVRFANVDAPGSTPSTVKFNISWPGASANPNKLNADGSGNKNRPNESGGWSLKVVYESYTDEFANVVLNNPGYWQVTVTGSVKNWREKQRIWVWTAHNQGGVFEY